MPRSRRPLIAVLLSAFVCPGAGQVYNRQKAKGAVLIALSSACAVVFMVAIGRMVLAAMPTDATSFDPAQSQALVESAMKSGSGVLAAAGWVLTIVWIVSMVDAYLVARRGAAEPPSTISR